MYLNIERFDIKKYVFNIITIFQYFIGNQQPTMFKTQYNQYTVISQRLDNYFFIVTSNVYFNLNLNFYTTQIN